MAEVFIEFAQVVVDEEEGVTYQARACGEETPDGTWHGWVEFVPLDGTAPIRSDRETTQPNRTDAIYWSTGLSHVYLEGALQRALKRPILRSPLPAKPSTATGVKVAPAGQHEAVLNPFSVYDKGESLLRNQLGA